MEDDQEYVPDEEAFASLVDLDGADLPPTAAELALAAFEPIDPTELLLSIRQTVDLATNYVISGTGTPEERLAIYVALVDALNPQTGSLPLVRRTLASQLGPDLGKGMECEGRWWAPERKKSVRNWDRPGLRSTVSKIALADVLNLETGEVRPPTAQESVERMWDLVDVAEGRGKVLRQYGIEDDEYAEISWDDSIKSVKRKSPPPDLDS